MIPKYRAYEKATGKMHKVVNLYFFDEELDVENFNSHLDSPYEDDTKRLSFNEVELMQYTGLIDENGADIYEGDILSNDYYEEYGVVKYKFGLYVVEYSTWQHDLSECYKNCEIVGNIYENPELLEDNEWAG